MIPLVNRRWALFGETVVASRAVAGKLLSVTSVTFALTAGFAPRPNCWPNIIMPVGLRQS